MESVPSSICEGHINTFSHIQVVSLGKYCHAAKSIEELDAERDLFFCLELR